MRLALVRALRLFAIRWPRASLPLARILAWLTMPLGKGIREKQIREIFPGLTPAEARAARRRTWSNFLLGEALDGALAGPAARRANPKTMVSPLIHELRPPVILASFHVGPYPALGPALSALPGDVVALHRNRWPSRSKVTLVEAGDDEWARVRSFHRAVTTLRSGGSVYVALDGPNAATVEARLFGRPISVARGAFALARIADVPIVPLAARWNGSRVEITCGDPISPQPTEAMTAAAATRWLERYLIASPGELSWLTLDLLAGLAVDLTLEQQGAQVVVPDLAVGGTGDRSPKDDRDTTRRES